MVLTYLCPVTDMPKLMTYFRLAAYPVYFRPRCQLSYVTVKYCQLLQSMAVYIYLDVNQSIMRLLNG